MELTKILIICVVVLFVLLLIIFPEFRKLCMGWTRLFIKDLATTPDGAAAIYEEKINEAREKYNKASDALKIASGRLETEQINMKKLKESLEQTQTRMESLVKNGQIEDAKTYSERRLEILSDIERKEQLIVAYTKAKEDAQEAFDFCQKNIRKLERESKNVVENMKVKAQLNEVYDSMDDLRIQTGTDKLIKSIKERNEDLNASVAGARVIHESKSSTKIARADAKVRKTEGDAYLDSLIAKYNKK